MAAPKKKKVVAANWKAKLTLHEALALTDEYTNIIKPDQSDGVEIILFPSLVHLSPVLGKLNGSGKISAGAQNMHWEDMGAFTGETTAGQLVDLGCEYVLLGHSERREYFKENYETINAKLKLAVKSGLKPILCLGESREERQTGISEMVIIDQLESALDGVNIEDTRDLIITYEPIWAIGSGNPVDIHESEHIMAMLNRYFKKHYGREKSEDSVPRLLYGGSIDAEKAESYMKNDSIDGVLVGRASLTADKFYKIVCCA